MGRLSIITINYNNLLGLKKTFNSIDLQSTKDFDWIVIDGGSTDGSLEFIEQNQHAMAFWSSEPDEGIYNAMNKGIRHARGEYLLFLNTGDTLFSEETIHQVLPYLKDYDFIIGNMYKTGSESTIGPQNFTNIGVVNVLTRSAYPHPSSFIRRTVFEKYGYYREDLRIVSDWWLYYRAILLGEATISYMPVDVSIFDETGISSTCQDILTKERLICLKEHKYNFVLYDFYNSNRDIVEALKSNKIIFFIFRIYFYFYRKFK